MTKKDYEMIAAAIKETHRTNPGSVSYDHALGDAAGNIADAMERNNPRFDRGRFLKACGVTA